MKILISAFSCVPGRGSEPGLGWEVAAAAARNNDVWVLLDAHNRPWIEQHPVAHGDLHATLVYIRLPWPFSSLFSVRWRGYLYYAIWQAVAFFKARRLHRRIGFELVHHVTYQNSWVPLWMGYLGIPFVWNGGCRLLVAGQLLKCLPIRDRLPELARSAIMRLFWKMTDRVVARRATVILSQSRKGRPRTAKVEAVACGGLSEKELECLCQTPPKRSLPFRIASIGRLVATKGTALALEAFAQLAPRISDSEYWIIGDGPERRRLEKLAAHLGLSDRTRFLGWRPRPQVFALLEDIDVVVHPSLRESFGYVVLEAMAAARPVICLDAGAPPTLVARGGCVIPVTDKVGICRDIATTLELWAKDPELREYLGGQGRALARSEYSWTKQQVLLQQTYDDAVTRAANKSVRERASVLRRAFYT